MKSSTCASCGSPICKEETYSREIEHGGSTIVVNRLKQFKCEACAAVFADDGQSRYNLSLIQRAKGLTPNLVLDTEVRAFRDSICITQREASRIFGGGLNAFSKYETGEVVQSDAMDNLLWLATKFPGLVPVLATRRSVVLSDKVRAACGSVLQISAGVSNSFSKISLKS